MSSAASAPTGCLVDPNRPLTFTFEGRTIPALTGQTIGAALYAAGVRVFTRSFKYHRPRGLFCVSGDCPNCHMQVDGRPNVRTCIEPVQGGEVVLHQNAWPSLGFDVLRVFDKLDRLLPVGFYYKRFHKPRWLWPYFEGSIRRVAGLGRVDLHAVEETATTIEHLHAEVCVVGGGPAGITAALEATRSGADVLLLEQLPTLGGHLVFDGLHRSIVEPFEAAAQESAGRLRTFYETTAFGLYEGNLLGAFQSDTFLKIRAKQIIVCTGSRQQPFVFPNNDLPGIFLGQGVQRLASLYGVRAGRRAVVLTDNDEGHRLATRLAGWGIEVAAVVDQRAARAPVHGQGKAPVLYSSSILWARGGKHLKAVRPAQVDGESIVKLKSEIACDLLCLVSHPLPSNELLRQGGVRYRHADGGWQPDRTVPGLLAAGGAAGTLGSTAQALEGRLRGAEAAAALGYATPALEDYRRQFADASMQAPCSRLLLPGDAQARKRFLCLCEDVTEKDIGQAVAEGFDHVETLKRYTTVNMGPCQGKVCGHAAIEACARATGRDLATIGTTTSRPPVVPVEMGILAAGRHHPVRRTPLHQWHQNAGAKWMDAGWWKRPESYGDPAAEVRAVRNAVGLIDVSTLGKIEVVGPDAAELLERVYVNKWADLKVGRARYGIMCNEDGILFDDGVAGRLAADRFYLTATTGNAEAVLQWLELWKATWRLNATLLNHTAGYAAMNLAGAKARELLGRLTALDLSADAFPYMAIREADVSAIPCRLLRIGFVGEIGYEIHCPSAYAWYLWKGLTEAGVRLGLRPFGVEAQRILRLEKGHLIIGQDTDALSNPLEAGLGAMVRFDKPIFVGREPLLRLKERGPRARLVGLQMEEPKQLPAEGCQVVDQGRPVGRVTSVRYSPTLEKTIGLAWVPASLAVEGGRFRIRSEGKEIAAVVARLPFYDRDGLRLKN